jgi:hypothetical protein
VAPAVKPLLGLSLGALALAAAAAALQAPPAAPSDGARAELRAYIEDVTQATGRRYGARDSAGRKMDTAKIIADPAGGYLAVYHTYLEGTPRVSVASSSDLLTWTFRRELGTLASQPYLVALPSGGFVAAWEQEPSNHLAFRHYASRNDLFAGVAERSFDAPRRLSACAEGTPHIESVLLSPNIATSTIEVGAHYFWNCDRDRQQRGTLRNFNAWTTAAQPALDDALLRFGVGGNVGDRDADWFRGYRFGVIEGQYVKGDFGSWRSFLYDHQTGAAEELDIRTDGGSAAFANPTLTHLVAPNGQSAVVVTAFVPSQGSAPGEAGELIYYRAYSPIVKHETESLRVAATSAADLHRTALDAGYSAGRGTILEANAAGDFVTYTVHVPQARTYGVRVGVKKLANRGSWRFDSNGVTHGPVVDGYAPAATFGEVDLGPVTFASAGHKAFRFRVTGRNASSTGFWIALDSIRLIPQ